MPARYYCKITTLVLASVLLGACESGPPCSVDILRDAFPKHRAHLNELRNLLIHMRETNGVYGTQLAYLGTRFLFLGRKYERRLVRTNGAPVSFGEAAKTLFSGQPDQLSSLEKLLDSVGASYAGFSDDSSFRAVVVGGGPLGPDCEYFHVGDKDIAAYRIRGGYSKMPGEEKWYAVVD